MKLPLSFFLSIGGVVEFIATIFIFLVLCAAMLLATAVRRDVLRRIEREAVIFLFGADAWCFVVLASGGFPGAMAYWVIHYSSFRYVPHGSTKPAESRPRTVLEKSRVEEMGS